MGAPEHLFQQTGSRNEHVAHFAIQPMGQARKGIQRNFPASLGLFQFAGPLSCHAQTRSERLGTHTQRQSDRLRPAAPRGGRWLQLCEFAKLSVKFGQAGEIQAIFQGANGQGNRMVACLNLSRQPDCFY